MESLARFSAEDILGLVSNLVKDEFESPKKGQKILEELKVELIKLSYQEKFNYINESLKEVLKTKAENPEKGKEDLANIMAQIEDIIAFGQILGGVNTNPPEGFNITRDYRLAFKLMISAVKRISWPNQNDKDIQEKRQRFISLCFRTIAEIININILYIDSTTTLNSLLLQINEIDQIGKINFASFFIPQLRSYYERFQVSVFVQCPSSLQLFTVIKAAIDLHIDISSSINQIPNDIHKFRILQHFCESTSENKLFYDMAVDCACNSDDIQVYGQALRSLVKKDDKRRDEITTKVFQKIAECLSDWINSVLISKNPLQDPECNKNYNIFNQVANIIGKDKHNELLSIVHDTDVLSAIITKFKKNPIELKLEEPMSRDIDYILKLGTKRFTPNPSQ